MEKKESAVVLLTGASSGLGAALSKALSSNGFIVYGTGRSWVNGQENDGIHQVKLDVTDTKSISQAVEYVINATGRIDVLINNAGVGIQGAAEDLSSADARRAFDTNFFGIHELIRAVLPHMRAQQSGKIINISSIAANMGLPYRGFYSASKAALDKYSEALNMEMSPWNIHVSCVEPGDFKSNIAASRIKPEVLSDAHAEGYERCMDKLAGQMNHAQSPDKVVKQVLSLARSKKPVFRARVGAPLEKLAVHLRYWLPSSVFQGMLKRFSE